MDNHSHAVSTAREAQARIMLAAEGRTGQRLFLYMRQLTHHFGPGMSFGIEDWAYSNAPVLDNYGIAHFRVQIVALVDHLVAKQDPAKIYHGSAFLDITVVHVPNRPISVTMFHHQVACLAWSGRCSGELEQLVNHPQHHSQDKMGGQAVYISEADEMIV
uniref:Uncharacterized protein n=1 Tax=Globodera rostochiensis TaxID=31243 RepID=A0A914I8Z1_GLORO